MKSLEAREEIMRDLTAPAVYVARSTPAACVAKAGIELLIALDRGSLCSQRFVLDSFPQPARHLAAFEVIEPRVVVDAVAQVHELDQVLRAQVEL
jgi:hypothetical protein